MQITINTVVGQEKFAATIEPFWGRLVEDLDVFPPDAWTLLLQFSLMALGGKCRPIFVGSILRRLIAAETTRIAPSMD